VHLLCYMSYLLHYNAQNKQCKSDITRMYKNVPNFKFMNNLCYIYSREINKKLISEIAEIFRVEA